MALLTNINGKFSVSDAGAVTFNNAFTFPTADGTANYVLQTNGSGQLAWALNGNGDISGSGTANTVTKFTGAKTIGNGPITFSGNNSTFTGSITIPDYIYHAGDGDTYFGFSANDEFLVVAGGSNKFAADANAAYMYYQGSLKLQTTSTGISVSGTAKATAIEIESAVPSILFNETDVTSNWRNRVQSGGYRVQYASDGTTFTDYISLGANAFTLAKDTTFTEQAFSAATSSGDASSTLTTKGYVDSLITGATIYRGTWDPDVSLNSGYGNPDLSGVTQTSGYYYICSADGAATPNGTGNEPDSWNTGDWVIWNDDIGTGEWQKIDNSSVLSGAGTGQTVALWQGASSVTDSETLGNAPITVSGNNSTFAGKILVGTGATAAASLNAYTQTVSANLYSALRIIENSGASSYWDIGATGGGSPDLNFYVNGGTTPKLTIDSSGNVGIGTTSPSKKLEVVGNAEVVGTLYVEAANNNIRLLDTNDSTVNFSVGVNGKFQVRDVDAATNIFQIEKGAASNSLYIDEDGNVGIGKTPQAENVLDIQRNDTLGSFITHRNDLGFALNRTYADYGNDGDTVEYQERIGVDGNNSSIGNYSNHTLAIRTNNQDRITILAGGNVGIGTTSPTGAKLVVNGITKLGTSTEGLIIDPSVGGGVLSIKGIDIGGAGYNPIHIQAGATTGMYFDTSGNVGIGTSSPFSTAKLQIKTAVNVNLGFQTGTTETTGFKINAFNDAANANIPLELNGSVVLLKTLETERMRIDSAGNVGIGTASPSQKLHVNSSTNNPTGIGLQNSERYYSVRSNNYSLVFTDETVGTERMRINSSGNVGIGTTNPILKLHLIGTNSLPATSGTTQNGGIRIENGVNNGVLDIGASNATGAPGWIQSTDKADLSQTYNLLLNPNGGNVGIGTISPNTKLQVSALNSNYVNLTGGFSVVKAEEGYGLYMGVASTGNSWIQSATYNNGITYPLILNGAGGNVGIGTTSPSQKLEVSGALVVGMTTPAPFWNALFKDYSDGSGVYISSVNGGGGKYIAGNAYYYNSALWRSDKTVASAINLDNGTVVFYTNSGLTANTDFTPTERMRITSTGNVGIGTTTPSYKLHVNGGDAQIANGSTATLYMNNSANYLYGDVNGVGIIGAGDNFRVKTNASERMRITNAGNVGIGTTSPSDKLSVYNGSYAVNIGGYSASWSGNTIYPTIYSSNPDRWIMITNPHVPYLENGVDGYTGSTAGARVRFASDSGSSGIISWDAGVPHYGGTDTFTIGRSDTALVTVKNNGNVGIGTTSPGAKLQVKVGSAFPLHAGNACGNVGIGVTSADISGNGLQPQLTVKGNISYGYNNYSSVANTWSNALNFSGYPAGLYQVNICKQSNASAYIIAQVKWSGTAGTVINTVTSFQYGITFSGTQLQSIINTTTDTSISVQCLVTFESCLP